MEDLFHIFPSNNFIDLGIYQTGREKCEPSHSFGPASRNHFLFHYIISGKGTLTIQGTDGLDHRFELGKDEGFLLWPGQVTLYIADNQIPWHYMWIEFDGLRAQEALSIAGFSNMQPVYRSTKTELREALKYEAQYIAEHYDASPYELIGHLYLFLDLLTKSLTNKILQPKNRLRNFYVHEAVAYIERHYMEDISVEEIAANSGLNRSYFGKIFRDEMGSTPQHFILNYRMVKATELLLHTEKSIAEISGLVGYPNQLHFSRAFKGVYGLSPRQWKNDNKASALALSNGEEYPLGL